MSGAQGRGRRGCSRGRGCRPGQGRSLGHPDEIEAQALDPQLAEAELPVSHPQVLEGVEGRWEKKEVTGLRYKYKNNHGPSSTIIHDAPPSQFFSAGTLLTSLGLVGYRKQQEHHWWFDITQESRLSSFERSSWVTRNQLQRLDTGLSILKKFPIV